MNNDETLPVLKLRRYTTSLRIHNPKRVAESESGAS